MSRKKTTDKDNILPVRSQLLLYRTEDGRTRIEVPLQEESVWLNQSAMAELFQSTKQNISLHLKNIFNEGDLDEIRVVKEYLTTAAGGENGCIKHYHSAEALIVRGKP
jgi:hypothetical protein